MCCMFGMLAPALSPVTTASKWTVVILEAGLLHLACFTHGSCCSAYCTIKPITQTRYRQPLLRLCQSCADHSARPAGTACTPQRKHQRTAIVDSNKARTVCCTTQPSNPHPPQQPQQGADKTENCHAARKDRQQVHRTDRHGAQQQRPIRIHSLTARDGSIAWVCRDTRAENCPTTKAQPLQAKLQLLTAATPVKSTGMRMRHASTIDACAGHATPPLTQLLGPGCRKSIKNTTPSLLLRSSYRRGKKTAQGCRRMPAATRAASQHTRRQEAAACG